VESRSLARDLAYYAESLAALRKYSPNAAVFLLVHKMDLVRQPRAVMLEKRASELRQASGDSEITMFGTSIYDESAWSQIVHTLIPNVSVLTRHLDKLATACSATEVILFECTTVTFLVSATSSNSSSSTPSNAPTPPSMPIHSPPSPPSSTSPTTLSSFGTHTSRASTLPRQDDGDPHRLDPRDTSVPLSLSRLSSRHFHSLEMELADFTAVLDELTKNTYVLIVVHDTTIETAALRLNIRLARKKFEELQSDSLLA
ncbi:Gtr1/RagA G protein conserved region-domain-containing protein, partial [Irpex rosettiformis]